MKWRLFLSGLALISSMAQGAAIKIEVNTPDNSILHGAAIYLTSKQPLPQVKTGTVADMDQVNRQFLPHILVVQKDTQIRFPNSDSIKHHVYSFSPAKVFELQLYKDEHPQPLPFDKTGTVEMGCNVHDWMLGYVYVVDTPYFTQLDKSNNVSLEAPQGEYTLHIRHPRIPEGELALSQQVTLGKQQKVSFNLKSPLLPGLQQFEEDTDEFSDYD